MHLHDEICFFIFEETVLGPYTYYHFELVLNIKTHLLICIVRIV